MLTVEVRDHTSIMDDYAGKDRGPWLIRYDISKISTRSPEEPIAIRALQALHAVVDGAIYYNQLLRGPYVSPVPEGQTLLEARVPPAEGAEEILPYQGREDQLIPVPFWVAAELAYVWGQLASLAKVTPKHTKGTPLDLNRIFGLKGTGSGKRGYAARIVTLSLRRELALAVHDLCRRHPDLSKNRAFQLVAKARSVQPDLVKKAWGDLGQFVQSPRIKTQTG